MEKLEISISMAGVPQIAHGIFKNENFHGGIGKYSAEMVAERSVVRPKQENSREIQCRNGRETPRCAVKQEER